MLSEALTHVDIPRDTSFIDERRYRRSSPMFGTDPDAWMRMHRHERVELMAAAAPRKNERRGTRSLPLKLAPAPTPACC
jgi:hypothetical protein